MDANAAVLTGSSRTATRTPARPAVTSTGLPIGRRRSEHRWIRKALVFVTCAVLLDALFGDRGLAESIRARHAYRQAEAGVARLKQENAGLREQIRRLREDPEIIEAVARQDLGLVRPGEILVIVKDVR
jgi:cell division protein FtsB